MNSVIKGAGYVLVHAPDMVLHAGTTQTTEKIVNPESEYLKELPNHIRSYEDVVAYMPNQTYIGNMTPEELAQHEQPWVGKNMENAQRYGKFGEIMPQDEFLLLMQACDAFELLYLDKAFVAATKDKLAADPVITEDIMAKVLEGIEGTEIKRLVDEEHAEPLYHMGNLVGCVKRAHDVDVNLSAHVMFENIACKASSVLALLHAVKAAGIDKADVEYVIDCAEEACGDMNQRGGGNFAKAAAEIAGLVNASGSDLRGFCAAPTHAMIEAASLVKAGSYKTVVVTAGGCTAKLGMNGKDHVKKGLPAIEDVLGGFAVVVTANDGVNPEINLENGDMEKKDLATFPAKHGLVGWAPTQGHIPSGVPYIGFAREDILAGKINRAMIIGKGSLFLGRMTNLFDGVSFIIQPNSGAGAEEGVSEEKVKGLIAKAMKEFAETLMADAE